MPIKHALFIFMLLFFTTGSYAQVLSATEKAIVKSVDENQTESLVLLEKLVNINSGTENLSGIREVGNIVQHEFEKLGFKATWVEQPANMKRVGTLLLKRDGNKGKRILLIGHLDTVFPQNSDFNHFAKQEKTATGPGVIDDKGGIVLLHSALKALHDQHLLEGMQITIAFTGDEENSGKPTSISRKALVDAAQNMDVALDFEPALHLNTATAARRGIALWMIKSIGNEAHSSLIFSPSIGYGAIFEIARILDALRIKLSAEKYITYNAGLMVGGTVATVSENGAEVSGAGKNNIVAQTAIAKGDLRFISLSQKESIKADMVKVVAQHLPGTKSEITFIDSSPPMPPTTGNMNLLDQYSGISEILGYGAVVPVDPSTRGAADMSYIASIVPACLGGLGPVGTGMHSTDETIDLSTLAINAQRASILIYRLGQ